MACSWTCTRAYWEVYPPHTEVFFLTGRDAAERILTWQYDDAAAALRQMFTAFQLIVCERDGPFHLPDDALFAPYRQRIHGCTLPPDFNHVSATEVRQRCYQGVTAWTIWYPQGWRAILASTSSTSSESSLLSRGQVTTSKEGRMRTRPRLTPRSCPCRALAGGSS